MAGVGNSDVAALFQRLAGYSRLHLAEAKTKSAAVQAVLSLPASTAWPDQETPERTTLWAGETSLTRLDALKAALQGERRGYEFYYAVAGTTSDERIRAMAKEFVKEEAEHVETLKQWIAAEESATRSKPAAGAPASL
jgi:rubrerythrin